MSSMTSDWSSLDDDTSSGKVKSASRAAAWMASSRTSKLSLACLQQSSLDAVQGTTDKRKVEACVQHQKASEAASVTHALEAKMPGCLADCR